MSIRIKQLNKYYGDYHALQNINLQVPTGSLTALLGPSGCGKTTLLRIIAGLERADSGELFFADDEVSNLHVRERRVGFMFQHYALFRHMTVFDNVAFGLQVLPKRIRPNKAEIADRVHELLQLVQLDWLAKVYPQQLSGGQRQRIALARALATRPKLLLLDEPFGALDAKVRKELRQWLLEIHHQLGITSVLVTHDQEEALEMADQIVVMNQGKVEQSGAASSLYDNPENVFVTEFLGEVNVFEDACIEHGQLCLGHYHEPITTGEKARQNVAVYIRPQEIQVLTHIQDNVIASACVEEIHAIGAQIRLWLRREDNNQRIQVWLSPVEFRTLSLQSAQTVWFRPQRLTMFRLPEMVDYVI
ncbi:sulfate ABC transporter ATP-binding protein [Snodgrassella alvi]|uniref:sulfate/molybdate ABC transporter ATP-binding protein n=1 Tax=Snodgrassella alvi TaxID=1196083 RepID=UPI000A073BAF|nr:sulfate ABC transporter ATP-binding protein [Snodgrassella alvi]ORF08468.1 sulfate ABC transporter ATP-binding protein [Snodgrassella alvi]ORF14611.1 sulfate ABC transporter ATP-binding protein [Snodgrassella alvi]ORF20062.1 sulfate ABC transporter ATP-binding protein [Snodgrassella alvi]ORF20395.1 sulfate ABC transporter ATP-binding protein [Snodgrassella alvi]